jgi:hypothetical protein
MDYKNIQLDYSIWREECKLLVQCQWKTCINYKDGFCEAPAIKLITFDYKEDNEELEGLQCATYKYDPFWMEPIGRKVDTKEGSS